MARNLLRGSIKKFESVANILPDSLTFHAWANALLALAKLTPDPSAAVRLLLQSFSAYKRVAAGFSSTNTENWKLALQELEARMADHFDWQAMWETEFETWFKTGSFSRIYWRNRFSWNFFLQASANSNLQFFFQEIQTNLYYFFFVGFPLFS